MTVANFNENLPQCKELYIKIDDEITDILEKTVDGIKI